MKYINLMFLSLLAAGFAAAAQMERYSATLAQPLSGEKVTVVANGNVWRCTGTTCILASEPKDPGSMRTCHQLKRQVGTLTAFGSTNNPYDETRLSKCNGTG